MLFAPTYPTLALISDWHQPTAGPEADAHQRRACELIEAVAPAAVLCAGDALVNGLAPGPRSSRRDPGGDTWKSVGGKKWPHTSKGPMGTGLPASA